MGEINESWGINHSEKGRPYNSQEKKGIQIVEKREIKKWFTGEREPSFQQKGEREGLAQKPEVSRVSQKRKDWS